jgi:hypothetical protein
LSNGWWCEDGRTTGQDNTLTPHSRRAQKAHKRSRIDMSVLSRFLCPLCLCISKNFFLSSFYIFILRSFSDCFSTSNLVSSTQCESICFFAKQSGVILFSRKKNYFCILLVSCSRLKIMCCIFLVTLLPLPPSLVFTPFLNAFLSLCSLPLLPLTDPLIFMQFYFLTERTILLDMDSIFLFK